MAFFFGGGKKEQPTGAARYLSAQDFQRIEEATGFARAEVDGLHGHFSPYMTASTDDEGNDASTADVRELARSPQYRAAYQ